MGNFYKTRNVKPIVTQPGRKQHYRGTDEVLEISKCISDCENLVFLLVLACLWREGKRHCLIKAYTKLLESLLKEAKIGHSKDEASSE